MSTTKSLRIPLRLRYSQETQLMLQLGAGLIILIFVQITVLKGYVHFLPMIIFAKDLQGHGKSSMKC